MKTISLVLHIILHIRLLILVKKMTAFIATITYKIEDLPPSPLHMYLGMHDY